MARVKITDAFLVPAYVRVHAEDGAYDAFDGYNVIAYGEVDGGGFRSEYLYSGRESELPIRFDSEEQAKTAVDTIKAYGSINPGLWHCYQHTDVNALPDYVTNWWRPEYN